MEGNKHTVQVIETTSRNKHKRDLDFFFLHKKAIEGLSETEGRQMGPEMLFKVPKQ